jgi:N-acetyl sugar amidotransferase
MKRCTKCVLPETWAGISFDKEGVCNYCRDREGRRKIDWQAKEEEFKAILKKCQEKAKNTNAPYDCVIPFSGGKDSTYTLYTLVKKYNMKPLAATFNHCFLTEVMKENHVRVFNQLGAAHIMYTPDWQIVKKLCAKSLRLTGDFCYHCHGGVYSFPMQIAAKYKIPAVIWGTSDYNLISDDNLPRDRKFFEKNVLGGVKMEDMVGDGITLRDLQPFMYPADEELKGIISINHGAYHLWNARQQSEIIKKELGWKGREVEGSYVDWDNVECSVVGVRDYIKFIRRGLGRSAQLASADIRHGVLTRDEALKIIEQYDGKRPDSLTGFLKDIGMSEEEFMEIAQRHKVV